MSESLYATASLEMVFCSLNLANSVSIVLYEALRQNGFAGMNLSGELHELHWK